ncbi:MAG: hypothetical protein HFG28_03115 [Eubacterium sp.]|nr:hypothetical protein [Eubacterium sp.]
MRLKYNDADCSKIISEILFYVLKVRGGLIMRTKKYTILLSSFLVMGNIIGFAILQFRMYHLIDIYGDGSQFFKNLREFFIVITSGLFTSSCVTLIISVREYLDEKEIALRNLLRLVNSIKEKYKKIRFYPLGVPENIIIPYLKSKHRHEIEEHEEIINFCKENNVKLDDTFMENYHKAKEKENKFREWIWKNEPNYIKKMYSPEENKEKYLDKRCSEIEEEYLHKVKEFIQSLQVFSDYDVYQVQEAFDKLCFLYHKGNKKILQGWLIPYLVTDIEFIKYYLNLLLTEEDIYIHSLYAFEAINSNFLINSKDRKKAYFEVLFQIDCGKRLIEIMLDSKKKNEKQPDIKDYFIRFYPDMSFGEDILLDALEK